MIDLTFARQLRRQLYCISYKGICLKEEGWQLGHWLTLSGQMSWIRDAHACCEAGVTNLWHSITPPSKQSYRRSITASAIELFKVCAWRQQDKIPLLFYAYRWLSCWKPSQYDHSSFEDAIVRRQSLQNHTIHDRNTSSVRIRQSSNGVGVAMASVSRRGFDLMFMKLHFDLLTFTHQAVYPQNMH